MEHFICVHINASISHSFRNKRFGTTKKPSSLTPSISHSSRYRPCLMAVIAAPISCYRDPLSPASSTGLGPAHVLLIQVPLLFPSCTSFGELRPPQPRALGGFLKPCLCPRGHEGFLTEASSANTNICLTRRLPGLQERLGAQAGPGTACHPCCCPQSPISS